ncbi:MAG: carbamoyltransferase HypF, partial [Candidatus Latescibacteria bacterium]|nr:carbamoyltransferase HypF [Candidatus Latescibacterota bacterium]
RYPFVNCTNCGPRFTIVQGVPYDRPKTTMASFAMCPVCETEYGDPNNRRYHAQPVACATCGPQISFSNVLDGRGPLGEAALQEAVSQINSGRILAVRGLGGFHICCLATDDTAVKRLRASKLRPSKPLALMVRSVEDAYAIADLTEMEARVLSEVEAPIVLLRKKDKKLPDVISPQNAYVGMMLPYTPLHHLLLDAVQAPLVMTSGNLSGAPLCMDNEDAIQTLGNFVDGFLLHNRPIERRCDDSVVAVREIDNKEQVQVVRRSRGFVPLPLMLPESIRLEKSILATGADLKNVSAIGIDQQVFLSTHIGDLSHPLARKEQARAVEDLEKLFVVQAECVVCDLHPSYASTQFAHAVAKKRGIPLLRVQHHHAHIGSCMIDSGCYNEPVVGIAFDGTGYGTDGQIWGGEFMWCHLDRFERCFHLEYLPLPGGDAAIQKPYRIALAYLMALMPECNVFEYFSDVPEEEIDVIAQMISKKINTPMTSSAGRLFDAVGTLLGLGKVSNHEGQIAMALEAAALLWDQDVTPYPFVIEGRQIRLGKLFENLLQDIQAGKSTPYMARRFHTTLAQIACETARLVCGKYGSSRVALSGGVWQNRLLLDMTTGRLNQYNFEILVHHSVPTNDGGIALGQVAVAAAMMKERQDVFGHPGKA